ncbi:MAG: DNA helicase RecQ [Bacteroides sp.]|nr:DNA helicase RecQ [Bacteroides sp.]
MRGADDIAAAAHALLRRFYGYDSFRPMQLDIITAAMQGRDSLVLMPTGGGKSICYQMPALLSEGVVVVVSPLIALMDDQVAALTANGIPAAAIHSLHSEADNRQAMEAMMHAKVKLVYISPERLMADMERWHAELPVTLFAIDEAHCISQWGHDFRPVYTRLRALKERWPEVPVMALTATADRLTRDDIAEQLGLRNPVRFTASFDRPNLSLRAMIAPVKQKRVSIICDMIRRHSLDSGIVYCLSRKATEEMAAELSARGFRAAAYHAGLPADTRRRVQREFIDGSLQAICATVAFGMGIDKSNIRWVIHNNLPHNIESYYQEIGRAGRDGLPAETLLFYSLSDFITLRKFADESGQRELNLQKLQRMLDYAESTVCRRRVLLNYFNEPSDCDCGNCDVCQNPPVRFDGTLIVQKVLSAIVRTEARASVNIIIDILRGTAATDVVRRQWHQLPTFGVGRDMPADYWRAYISQMIQMGLIDVAYEDFNHLRITQLGADVLRERRQVMLARFTRPEPKRAGRPSTRRAAAMQPVDNEEALLAGLKKLRLEVARREGVPPYIVFSDKTLRDMARRRPRTMDEFAAVEGVGERKLVRYWRQFTDFFLNR